MPRPDSLNYRPVTKETFQASIIDALTDHRPSEAQQDTSQTTQGNETSQPRLQVLEAQKFLYTPPNNLGIAYIECRVERSPFRGDEEATNSMFKVQSDIIARLPEETGFFGLINFNGLDPAQAQIGELVALQKEHPRFGRVFVFAGPTIFSEKQPVNYFLNSLFTQLISGSKWISGADKTTVCPGERGFEMAILQAKKEAADFAAKLKSNNK